MKKNLPKPRPCRFPLEIIRSLGESFAKSAKYSPGGDLRPIVERLGGEIHTLKANSLKTPPEPSCIEVYEGGSFRIYLSPYNFPLGERFTIAHELGHFVLHSLLGKQAIKAAHSSSLRNEEAEVEAHEFACAFLMPEEEVKRAIKAETGKNSLALAAYFGVPEYVALGRMRDLEIV